MIERRGPARPPFRIGLATVVERANAARDQGRWSEATAFAVLGLEAVLSRGAPSDEATPFQRRAPAPVRETSISAVFDHLSDTAAARAA